MNKLFTSIIFVLLCSLPCANSIHGQLLKGTVKGKDVKSILFFYSPDSDPNNAVFKTIELDKTGKFVYNPSFKSQWCDFTVYVNQQSTGVHLEKGKCAILNMTEGADKKLSVVHAGDNKVLSEFYDYFVNAFESGTSDNIDPASSGAYQKMRSSLDKHYAELMAKLPMIKNSKIRSYYKKRADYTYVSKALSIMQYMGYTEKKKMAEYPDYAKLIKEVDLNDNMSAQCEVAPFLIESRIGMDAYQVKENESCDYAIKYMDAVNQDVRNATVRKYLAYDCFMKFRSLSPMATADNIDRFWTAYKSFIHNDTALIARYQPKIDYARRTARGTKAIDTTMSDPEGKSHKISEFYGKLLYIDVWATWCHPCCEEIPYLAKVAEHYKGNDKIQIISISCDNNRDSWIAKLKKDNPSWLQFILNKGEDKAFGDAWCIEGIPRFIVIDKEGKTYMADAPRPSDSGIIEFLDKAMK